MKTKTCDVCGDEFVAKTNTKRCSDECKKAGKARSKRTYDRKHYQENREHYREQDRERYENNREAILEQKREYNKTDAGRDAKKRKRAKRRGAPSNGSIKHFKRADKCCRCGSTDDLELEHITPISAGGTNFIENLTTMCADCNRGPGGKHTLGPHRWAEFVCWFLNSMSL